MKKFIAILFLSAVSSALFFSQSAVRESYPVSAVRLTGGPMEHARRMDTRYLLALDPDRLLAPYRKEAGLKPIAENYSNWENTGLDGHIGGHYLSALSYMYAASGDKEIKDRLDYMIAGLRQCADASGDGYLCGVPGGRGMWEEIRRGDIRAGGFDLNGAWVPLYNIHKTYAGLRDAWLQTGNTDARDMLVSLADWMLDLTKGLSDQQIQSMLVSEHGGLNEVFADVAAITGDSKYIELARRFSHKTVLDPLLHHRDELTGMHANTQIPKIIGFKRIADIDGDKTWNDAATYFWDTVTGHRSVSIGGNSVCEHFHPSDDFTQMLESEQGPETCNTYNMLRLSKMLYESSSDSRYLDFYERALFNHILSTINPVQGGFVYFTPMRPGHYRVYSQPQTSMWCCVGSGMENHARYGEMIYSHNADTVFVNLFIPSELQTGDAIIEQTTSFPESDFTRLTVKPSKGKKRMTLALRAPVWSPAEGLELSVGGRRIEAKVDKGFVSVTRDWSDTDTLLYRMPMHLAAEQLPDGSDYVSYVYGPVVLAARCGDDRQDGLYADDSRGGHIAGGPRRTLDRLPGIVDTEGDLTKHLSAVPGKPLEFRLTGLTLPQYEGMTLEPFSRIHDSRYMVYIPCYTPESWEARREELAREEAVRVALEAATADMVVCGEQQPESDHFVAMKESDAGSDGGAHWRESTAWFSYRMRTSDKSPQRLRVRHACWNDRDATVYVDDVPVGTLTGERGEIIETDLALPEGIAPNSKITVKIAPDRQPRTPRVYSIRMLDE